MFLRPAGALSFVLSTLCLKLFYVTFESDRLSIYDRNTRKR
jgi:hypothetical protein